MKVLFVDACPRKESRSRQLGEAFLNAYLSERSDAKVQVLDLNKMNLMPLTGEQEAARSAKIDLGELDDPEFAPARAFASADLIVIAAPYWDYAFPACLKVFIERVCVRTLTFIYKDDQPVGLCRAQDLVYLTTSGSPIGQDNWGGDYLNAVTGRLLGVRRFHQISAEGLDLLSADPKAILERAQDRARALAAQLCSC